MKDKKHHDQGLNTVATANKFALIVVFFVILAGGVVRSTGSGMGCPDWPKCFGKIIPPTRIDQLPKDYKLKYSEVRRSKNERFAKLLTALGYKEKANKILNDPSVYLEQDFNPVKTWIEYINRLLGVIAGFAVLNLCIQASRSKHKSLKVSYLSLFALVTLIIQAIAGAFVVSTNLMPWMVTFHLLLAFLLVTLLIEIHLKLKDFEKETSKDFQNKAKYITAFALLILLLQIILGAQIRESVNELSTIKSKMALDSIGAEMLMHRITSGLFMLITVYMYYINKQNALKKWYLLLLTLTIIQGISGGTMYLFGIPPFFQPIHLITASLQFAVLIYLIRLPNKLIIKNTKILEA